MQDYASDYDNFVNVKNLSLSCTCILICIPFNLPFHYRIKPPVNADGMVNGKWEQERSRKESRQDQIQTTLHTLQFTTFAIYNASQQFARHDV
jgi:hypothetical protein